MFFGFSGLDPLGKVLVNLAAAWLQEAERGWPTVRFDVVSVLRPRTGPLVVEHLRGVL